MKKHTIFSLKKNVFLVFYIIHVFFCQKRKNKQESTIEKTLKQENVENINKQCEMRSFLHEFFSDDKNKLNFDEMNNKCENTHSEKSVKNLEKNQKKDDYCLLKQSYEGSISDLHLKLIFDTIIAELNGETIDYPNCLDDFDSPIFVSWTKTVNKEVRGCIGSFQSLPMSKQLQHIAKQSAFHDTRFPSIELKEIPELTAGFSVLKNFENRNKLDDWEIGKHGIIIGFQLDSRNYQATYLPDVIKDQKWDKSQAIEAAIQKSGYKGNFDCLNGVIYFQTYESEKRSMSYQEYIKKFGNNSSVHKTIIHATHKGTWYDGSAKDLQNELERYLKNAQIPDNSSQLKAIVSP